LADQFRPTDSGSDNGMARTARKLRVRADYLIVGGGMAGIAALAEARRRGIDAICLEARLREDVFRREGKLVAGRIRRSVFRLLALIVAD
jgi:hypothetical protein